MSFARTYMKVVQKVLPSPFAIAVILTVVTSLLALLLTEPLGSDPHIVQLFYNWEAGVWSLLKFTMQMMLILVLGHSLALSKPVLAMIRNITGLCTSNARSAIIVTFISILAGYFNWGLGLILGAILARKVENMHRKKAYR